MGTIIRPELSEKNKYWIERHRYYELKHFCLQYPIWKKSYTALGDLAPSSVINAPLSKTNSINDPVARCVEARSVYFERMHLVEQTAMEAAEDLSSYLLEAVTEGVSYDYLKARLDIPCCRDTYYDLYRRFFWLLNKARN